MRLVWFLRLVTLGLVFYADICAGAGGQHHLLKTEKSPTPPNYISTSNYIGQDSSGCMGNDIPVTKEDSLLYMYIINHGIYGVFAIVGADKTPTSLQLLQNVKEANSEQPRLRRSRIFGPTCAGEDCLVSECKLPEIHVGQWFYLCNMGAYSFSLASGFNGFELPLVFPDCSKHVWNKVYPTDERTSCSPVKKRKL